MRVHHTQIKQAKALGFDVKIDVATGTITLVDTKGQLADITGTDAKAVLAEALRVAKDRLPKPNRAAKRKAAAKARKARREDDEDGGEDDEEEKVSGSVVKPKYKAIYAKNELKDTNNDAFAHAFAEFTVTEDGELDVARVITVARDNGIDTKKYSSRNRGWEGRLRMTIGNILRGKVRRGEDVTIGPKTFKGAKQD